MSAAEIDAGVLELVHAVTGLTNGAPDLDILKFIIARLEPRFAGAHISSTKKLDDRV